MGMAFEDNVRGYGCVTVRASHGKSAYAILLEQTTLAWPQNGTMTQASETSIPIYHDDMAGVDAVLKELGQKLGHLPGYRAELYSEN